jgi:hypothetical protein
MFQGHVTSIVKWMVNNHYYHHLLLIYISFNPLGEVVKKNAKVGF